MSLADYGNAELLVYRLGVRKDTVKVPEEVLAACQYDMDDSVESTCDINGDYIKAGSRLYPHISQTLRPFLAKRDFGFSSLPTLRDIQLCNPQLVSYHRIFYFTGHVLKNISFPTARSLTRTDCSSALSDILCY